MFIHGNLSGHVLKAVLIVLTVYQPGDIVTIPTGVSYDPSKTIIHRSCGPVVICFNANGLASTKTNGVNTDKCLDLGKGYLLQIKEAREVSFPKEFIAVSLLLLCRSAGSFLNIGHFFT